jgi:hypothetical protein
MIVPQLPKYVSAAFGSLDLPLETRPPAQRLRRLCCHKFKPKNITDDIFLAQILGHKLLGPNASLSVGQSYKDFYCVSYTWSSATRQSFSLSHASSKNM